jgi:hypothetical protein
LLGGDAAGTGRVGMCGFNAAQVALAKLARKGEHR